MPRLTKGNTLYGSGASPGIMSCIAGRLLCDTYLCSRDLLKEVTSSAVVVYIVEANCPFNFFGIVSATRFSSSIYFCYAGELFIDTTCRNTIEKGQKRGFST